MASDVIEGRQEREAVLNRMEVTAEDVLPRLRERARLVAGAMGTASANDLRSLLSELGYRGDRRLLGAVFHTSEWVADGWTQIDNPKAHARPIRTFRLRETHDN